MTDYDNDFDEILPGIYLGCYQAIFGKKFKETKIDCVISLTPEEETPLSIPCYRLPISGRSTLDEIKSIIIECVEIMNNNKGKSIYVHCYEGVSRSAICILYYMYKTLDINIMECYALLKEKRSSVNPNEKMIGAMKLLLDEFDI